HAPLPTSHLFPYTTLFRSRRRAGHVTKPARVRATDRDIERPVRQALVNEMVFRDDGGRVPDSDAGVGRARRRQDNSHACLNWSVENEAHFEIKMAVIFSSGNPRLAGSPRQRTWTWPDFFKCSSIAFGLMKGVSLSA